MEINELKRIKYVSGQQFRIGAIGRKWGRYMAKIRRGKKKGEILCYTENNSRLKWRRGTKVVNWDRNEE